jgi:hypothetical protein
VGIAIENQLRFRNEAKRVQLLLVLAAEALAAAEDDARRAFDA